MSPRFMIALDEPYHLFYFAFLKIMSLLCAYMMREQGRVCAHTKVQWSEDSFAELIFSLQLYTGSGLKSRSSCLQGECSYPLSHLAIPCFPFEICCLPTKQSGHRPKSTSQSLLFAHLMVQAAYRHGGGLVPISTIPQPDS